MLLHIFKKTPLLLCAGAMIVFSSCKGEEAESIDTDSTTTETITDSPRSLKVTDIEDQEIKENTVNDVESEALKVSPNINNNPSANLNPPHGQPGHDCAVPVGQPLPSASGASMPVVNKPTINQPVRINPPHGQPGHDCAVAVGDPLN